VSGNCKTCIHHGSYDPFRNDDDGDDEIPRLLSFCRCEALRDKDADEDEDQNEEESRCHELFCSNYGTVPGNNCKHYNPIARVAALGGETWPDCSR
jgi:hypothetical protein